MGAILSHHFRDEGVVKPRPLAMVSQGISKLERIIWSNKSDPDGLLDLDMNADTTLNSKLLLLNSIKDV